MSGQEPEHVRVVLPPEEISILSFRQDELRGVAAINAALVDFEYARVFRWHLSLMLQLEDVREDRLPTNQELGRLRPWEETLEEQLRHDASEKQNALFFASISWNSTRELIYRVHDPELANDILAKSLKDRDYPRPFDYRIDDDPQWRLAEWHMDAIRSARLEP